MSLALGVPTGLAGAIPSPTVGVWHVLGFPIRAYAMCILAGIVVAYLITNRRLLARGGQPADVRRAARRADEASVVADRHRRRCREGVRTEYAHPPDPARSGRRGRLRASGERETCQDERPHGS